MSVMTVVASSPPTRASTSPIQVRIGTVAASARQRGTTSHRTGSNPMARKASISSDTFIVAISRSEAGARSAGHDHRRHQGAELAELRDDHELGHVGDGAEPSELGDAEKPDDDADEEIGGARHRQRVRPDLLDQPWKRAPIDRAW